MSAACIVAASARGVAHRAIPRARRAASFGGDPQRRGGGERREQRGEDQQRAEQREVAADAEGRPRPPPTAPAPKISTGMQSGTISTISSTAPLRSAERQRRAQAAEQAEDRRAEQQRQATSARMRVAGQAEHEPEQRRREHQRQAGDAASATTALADGDRAARGAAGEQHLLERAVGVVAGVELASPTASPRAARRPRPRPGAIRRSVCGSGPTPSGNRLIATVKKASGSRASMRRRAGQAEVARQDDRRTGRSCAGRPALAARGAAPAPRADDRGSRRGDRQRQVAGQDDDAAAPRHAARAARPGSPTPSTSSASYGSSSSQRRAGGRRSASRASATRRRWPCDSVRTGASCRVARPSRSRAASMVGAVGPAAVRAEAGSASDSRDGEVVLQGIGMGEVEQRPAGRLRRASRSCRPPGGDSPARVRSRVVLPWPLAPRIQTMAPGGRREVEAAEQRRSPRRHSSPLTARAASERRRGSAGQDPRAERTVLRAAAVPRS